MLLLRNKSHLLGITDALDTFEIQQASRSPLPANPEPLSSDAGWGFDFQNLLSTHVEEPPMAPVIPTSLSYESKQALSSVSEVSGLSEYATPSQTATHTTGTRSRNRRPPSVISSDEEVSSDLSPDSSLSTSGWKIFDPDLWSCRVTTCCAWDGKDESCESATNAAITEYGWYVFASSDE